MAKFTEQFSEEEVNFPFDLNSLINPCIFEAENEYLTQIPDDSEIKNALFGMSPLMAPGPNGFPAIFYKSYWTIVGADVLRAVTSFFQSGKLLIEINNTLTVLIPKVPNPSTFNHFRPISLCNVIYKNI